MAEMQTLPTIGAAPLPAVTRVLSRYDRGQLADFIEVAIGLLDTLDGDPDLEPNGDDENVIANGDTQDAAWLEWDQVRSSSRGQQVTGTYNEDDEPYGDETDGTFAEDEPCAGFAYIERGPGCLIADPDKGADDEGEADNAEDSFAVPVQFLARASDGPGCIVSDNDGVVGVEC